MNILISGSKNRNILRYSIENDSFTKIPFQFAPGRRKILLNAGRLYLIECDNGMVYESEDGDETAWKQVGRSIIQEAYPSQIYCAYNKEAIYIGVNYIKVHEYYRFDLGPKSMIPLSV
ncbi:unnamed protein product [Blepharisma stoltei]|uniref:F-box protein n=1 Tax=Blepharisma stoltei TaxID=1481888 RepID=A0AAU9JSS8_9CILI|nr:unnamed protein product [Blepharisma stoltei]